MDACRFDLFPFDRKPNSKRFDAPLELSRTVSPLTIARAGYLWSMCRLDTCCPRPPVGTANGDAQCQTPLVVLCSFLSALPPSFSCCCCLRLFCPSSSLVAGSFHQSGHHFEGPTALTVRPLGVVGIPSKLILLMYVCVCVLWCRVVSVGVGHIWPARVSRAIWHGAYTGTGTHVALGDHRQTSGAHTVVHLITGLTASLMKQPNEAGPYK